MPIHPTAIVDSLASIHETAQIGPYAVIEGPVTVGAGCQIDSAAILRGKTVIGEGCHIHSHAVVGDVPQDRAYKGEESECRVGAGTMIREGCTIHRASGEGAATVVGERCLLMTNSHIGHNCVVGNDVVLVSGSLLGGHVHIADRVIVSGNAAVHQFVRVGTLALIGGLSKVTQDIPPYFMTDQLGAISGVNWIGLKRAGFTAEQRSVIRKAYRIIYRGGLANKSALESLRSNPGAEMLEELIAFLAVPTPRGLAKPSSIRKQHASGDLGSETSDPVPQDLPQGS